MYSRAHIHGSRTLFYGNRTPKASERMSFFLSSNIYPLTSNILSFLPKKFNCTFEPWLKKTMILNSIVHFAAKKLRKKKFQILYIK